MASSTTVNGLICGASHIDHVTYEDVMVAANYIRDQVPGDKFRDLHIGIICGTGWQDVAKSVQNPSVVDYKSIPGFPVPTVSGHIGRLVFGDIHGKSVVLMQGRVHMYEGYPMPRVTMPVRVMRMLGVKVLFLSNAGGGLNPAYRTGDLMIMRDHIYLPGLCGMSPLVGPNDDRMGPRFPAMSQAYDSRLIALAHLVGGHIGVSDILKEGVYFMGGGPQFESVAESRMLQMLGVDAAGMSTAPEVVVATQCGMTCFGLTLISNMVVMDYKTTDMANHTEVLETGQLMAPKMRSLLEGMIQEMDMEQFQ